MSVPDSEPCKGWKGRSQVQEDVGAKLVFVMLETEKSKGYLFRTPKIRDGYSQVIVWKHKKPKVSKIPMRTQKIRDDSKSSGDSRRRYRRFKTQGQTIQYDSIWFKVQDQRFYSFQRFDTIQDPRPADSIRFNTIRYDSIRSNVWYSNPLQTGLVGDLKIN